MIKKQEIMRHAKALDLSANTIEKDYVLNWILLGIFSNTQLNKNWIFKGGTCLKKCYFKEYRFSEDLDFTLTNADHLGSEFLKSVFTEIGEWIYEQSSIEIPKDSIYFESYSNPRGKISVEGKLGYKGPMKRQNNISRVKLDLTNDELVCSEPVSSELYHPYTDEIPEYDGILTYSLEEIFAEKTRALAERMRPRDLYDVVHLYNEKRHELDVPKYIKIFSEKCEFKNITVPTYRELSEKSELPELVSEWENMLAHQIGNLESCQTYWQQLAGIFDWIEGAKK
jgi:predicted nucleotidyltransferase component of viral defense system